MNQSVDKLGNSSGVGVDIEHDILGKLSPGTHTLEHLRNGSTLVRWKDTGESRTLS